MTLPKYLILSVVVVGSLSLRAQTPPVSLTPSPGVIPHNASTEKAIATATAFMTAVVRDSTIDNVITLCGLPFCHDDSVILTTRAELRTALTELLGAAAKERARTHPQVDSVYVLDVRKQAMFAMVPMNIYFTVVTLKLSYQGKEATRLLILAVQLTDDARVVGIED